MFTLFLYELVYFYFRLVQGFASRLYIKDEHIILHVVSRPLDYLEESCSVVFGARSKLGQVAGVLSYKLY